MNTTLTNDQITAGAAVLCDHGQPIGRNAAIEVFDAMQGDVTTPSLLARISKLEQYRYVDQPGALVLLADVREAIAAPSPQIAEKVEDTERLLRAGRNLHELAKRMGWPDDGEGAYEYVQRLSYELGQSDAIAASRRATTVRPTEIALSEGATLRYEARTTGAPGWLLYAHGKLLRALSLDDVEVIEATIAATNAATPAPASAGQAGQVAHIATVVKGNLCNRLEWVSDEAMDTPVGTKLFAERAAAPADQPSAQKGGEA